ncbi:MAG: hypothetical protein ABUL71_00125 [Gemmatimonadota bacterium]
MRRALTTLLMLLVVAGCASSHPVDLLPKPAMDPRDVLEFRYRGETITLESVRYTADSVTGIPWRAPTDPRTGYLLADVTQAKQFGTGKSGDHAARSILITLGAGVLILGYLFAHALASFAD